MCSQMTESCFYDWIIFIISLPLRSCDLSMSTHDHYSSISRWTLRFKFLAYCRLFCKRIAKFSYFFEILISLSLNISPKVGLLGSMPMPVFSFQGTSALFGSWPLPCVSSTSSVQGNPHQHILSLLFCFKLTYRVTSFCVTLLHSFSFW